MNKLKKIQFFKKGVKFSLAVKLIIPLVLLITLVLTATGTYDINSTSERMTSDLEISSNVVSNRLSVGLTTPLWNLDKKTIEAQINGEIEHPDLNSIIIFDEYGKVLLSKKKNSNGEIVNGNMQDDKEGLIFSSKNVKKEGKVIGRVDVYLTNENMLKRLNKRATEIIISTVLVDLAIAILLFFMLRSKVLNPVNNLTKVANKLYSTIGVAPSELGDEIQTLNSGMTGVLAMVSTLLQEVSSKEKRGKKDGK